MAVVEYTLSRNHEHPRSPLLVHMKTPSVSWAATLLLVLSCPVFAQSSFLLQNLYTVYGINAPVFDGQGAPLAGPSYRAELWGAATPDSLAPALDISRGSTRLLVPFASGGYFFSTSSFLSVPTVLPGGYAWLQVRAWDARLGATYEAAVTAGLGGYGESPLFYAKGGDPVSPTPTLGAPLIGLQSFTLLPEVPEPSTWALLVCGAFGVWLAARGQRRLRFVRGKTVRRDTVRSAFWDRRWPASSGSAPQGSTTKGCLSSR